MATSFTYAVKATVWTSGGTGEPWQGEATIAMRADSSAGLRALREAVRTQVDPWLRGRQMTPSGRLDLTEWGPKPRRR